MEVESGTEFFSLDTVWWASSAPSLSTEQLNVGWSQKLPLCQAELGRERKGPLASKPVLVYREGLKDAFSFPCSNLETEKLCGK